MLLSLTAITGWFTGSDQLKSIIPGQTGIKFNTALCLLTSSIILFLNFFNKENDISFTKALAIFVALFGLLTLIEYIFNLNLGIDEIFLRDPTPSSEDYYPGRMSLVSAVNFLFIGICIVQFNKEKSARYQLIYLLFIVFFSSLMLIGFNYILDIPSYLRLGFQGSACFLLLTTAIYFSQNIFEKKMTFEFKLYTVFSTTITLIIILGLFSSYYNKKRSSTNDLVQHTNIVLSEAEKTLSFVKDIESGGRGYILTADSSYLENFTFAKNEIPIHLKKLKDLTADNVLQHARIDTLQQLAGKRIDISLQYIKARNESGFETADDLRNTLRGKFYTDMIRRITMEIQDEENRLLNIRQAENDKSISSFNGVFYVFLGSVSVLLTTILFSIRNNITVRKKAEQEITGLNNNLEKRVNERTEELYNSEKKYRYLFENNPMPMYVLELETYRFLNVNMAAIEHFKYSNEEFMSMSVFTIIPDEERERLSKLSQDKTPVTNISNRGIWKLRKKDGTIVSVEALSHDIIFEGKTARLVLCFDVTEKVKTENEIKRLNANLEEKIKERTEQLETVNKELEAFSYSVSHDLRAPLRSINGFAKILEEDHSSQLGSDGNRLLKIIKDSAKNMGSLIDDLLTFSRLGKKDIQKSDVNMNDLVNFVIEDIERSLKHSAGIKINDLHDAAADRVLIRQVMTNLLLNAIKYSSKKEKPVIKISSEKKGDEIIYSVKDNGVGFDMQYAGKLFGVFQRLHSASEFEGTGVGLALVHRIITKHGGKVRAEGKENEGAVFYFSLPA